MNIHTARFNDAHVEVLRTSPPLVVMKCGCVIHAGYTDEEGMACDSYADTCWCHVAHVRSEWDLYLS